MNIHSQLDNMEIVITQREDGNFIVESTKPARLICGYIYKVGKFFVATNALSKPVEVARNLQEAGKGFMMVGFPEIKPIYKFYNQKA